MPFQPKVALRRPADAEDGDRPAEVELRKFLRAHRQPGEGRHGWRRLGETARAAVFIRGSVVSQSAELVRFDLVNGVWVSTFDWHPCTLRARRGGHAAVPWTLARGQRLDASTKTVKVWINSFECDNTAVEAPVFRREGHRLLMTLWPYPKPPSNLACPEVAIARKLAIHLPERLGDLKLYDGGFFPPHLAEPPSPSPAFRSGGRPRRLPGRPMHGGSATRPDPALAEWPGWPYRVTSGRGPSFSLAQVFSGPTDAERGSLPAEAALQREISARPAEIWHHDNWRRGPEAHGFAEFFHGQIGGEFETPDELESIIFHRHKGRWNFFGSGSFTPLETVADGRAATTWALAKGQPLPGPRTTRVRINAGARCSTREPPSQIKETRFVTIGDKLVMTIWLRSFPLPKNAHGESVACAFSDSRVPEPDLTVELPEPLGERELVDGGVFPPEPARVYEEPSVTPLLQPSRSAFLRQYLSNPDHW